MQFTNKRQLHLDVFAGWNILKHAHMSYILKIRRLFQNFLYTLQFLYPLQNKTSLHYTSNTQFYQVRWTKPIENFISLTIIWKRNFFQQLFSKSKEVLLTFLFFFPQKWKTHAAPAFPTKERSRTSSNKVRQAILLHLSSSSQINDL